MAIISERDFSKIRDRHNGEKIVYASGVFDLPHPGHVLFFEDCKKHGDVLVVGVSRGEKNVKERKGPGRPVMNFSMRLKMVDSLKPVDYCFARESSDNNNEAGNPLDFLEVVFKNLQPDFYAVNNDAFDMEYRKKLSEKYNVKFIILERWCPPEFENVSTTSLIEKIQTLPKK